MRPAFPACGGSFATFSVQTLFVKRHPPRMALDLAIGLSLDSSPSELQRLSVSYLSYKDLCLLGLFCEQSSLAYWLALSVSLCSVHFKVWITATVFLIGSSRDASLPRA